MELLQIETLKYRDGLTFWNNAHLFTLDYIIIKVLLFYIGVLSSLITIGLYFFKQRNTSFFIIVLYLLYGLGADFFINKLYDHIWGETFTGFRIFTAIEYFFITLYIYKTLQVNQLKKIIFAFSILFSTVSIFDFYRPHQDSFDSLPAGLSAILIILYSTLFFYEQLNNAKTVIYDDQRFWVIVAFVIYFSGTFFIFIFYNYYKSPLYISFYSAINGFFTLSRNILLIISIFMGEKKKNDFFFQ